MHLVEDGALPRRFGLAREPPREGRIDYSALLHQRRAVALVKGFVLVRMIELIAEQFRSPAKLAHELPRVGIDDQLVRVKAMASIGRERTVNAVTIDRAGARMRQIAMPYLIGIFRQVDALDFTHPRSSNKQSSTLVA